MEGLEDNDGRLACRLAWCGIVVLAGQDSDSEGPTGKAEELHDGGQDADHGRRRDDGQVSRRSTYRG